ncbi:HAMP domain-containing sensor histidine kinase [[Clostridium] dakarense]|uniref:HAMP domain-containing sensor histidine kinase n=1 Tax=Faecalimicrobium dakarense TaxID=1301100 RepID=UPI0004B5D5D1|nr:sensor histidine kinase [[Clostridium] dakarense]
MHEDRKILEDDFYKSNLFEYNTLRPISYWLGEVVKDNDKSVNEYIRNNSYEEYDDETDSYKMKYPSKEQAQKNINGLKNNAKNRLNELENIKFIVINNKTNEYYSNTEYDNLSDFKKNINGHLDIEINKTDKNRTYIKDLNNKTYRSNPTVEWELLNAINTDDIQIYISFLNASYPKSSNYFGTDKISENYSRHNAAINNVKLSIPLFISSLIVSIVALILYKRIDINLFDKNSKLLKLAKLIPIEILAVIIFLEVALAIGNASNLSYVGYGYNYRVDKIIYISQFYILSILLILTTYFTIKKYKVYNSKEELVKSSIIMNLSKYFIDNIKTMKDSLIKVPLSRRITLIGIGCLIINGIGVLFGPFVSHILTVIGSTIVLAFFIIYTLKTLAYASEIIEGTEKIKKGDLNYKIPVKGNDNFTVLAQNINNIGEGLEKSIDKQLKSERMKSELITNVSHDLKTPLTSIINYVELIKKEKDIRPEHIKDYVNVLDSKSKRLKLLIEDLFEASKVGSGNIELNMEKIDVKQLLRQSIGEMEEKLSNSNLDIKLNLPEDNIYIYADGRRMYRVFENLLSNIAKYSLDGTRVYIDLLDNEDNIKLSMKNISSYELNFDPKEIMERFKRADESRNTEGSGLGLAIAKDLVNLQGGNFEINIDGDLFKSTLEFKKIKEK